MTEVMNDTITKELEQYVGKYFRFKDKFSYNASKTVLLKLESIGPDYVILREHGNPILHRIEDESDLFNFINRLFPECEAEPTNIAPIAAMIAGDKVYYLIENKDGTRRIKEDYTKTSLEDELSLYGYKKATPLKLRLVLGESERHPLCAFPLGSFYVNKNGSLYSISCIQDEDKLYIDGNSLSYDDDIDVSLFIPYMRSNSDRNLKFWYH